MKSMTKSFGVGIAMFSLLVFPAYAQLGTTLDSATDTNIDVNANINAGLDTSVDTELNANSEVEIDTSGNLNTDNTIDSRTGATLKVNASGTAITSSAQVNSEEDLQVFSANIASKNKAVVRVRVDSENTTESEVKVVYRHKGRFLGFIPVTIKSTTVVKARANVEAEVKSSLAWWSFLVTGENYNRATLESRIKNNARVKANAKVDVSAQAKAQIAEAVVAELQANATSQASANVK